MALRMEFQTGLQTTDIVITVNVCRVLIGFIAEIIIETPFKHHNLVNSLTKTDCLHCPIDQNPDS